MLSKLAQNKIAFIALAMLPLSACSTTSETIHVGSIEIHDPLEDFNRRAFAFNDAIDEAVAEPVARNYREITPEPVRTGLHNFLKNLKSPVQVANQLLQGDITGAADSLTRTLANTFFGLAGTIDIAAMEGLKEDPEDFGQTLAVWGVHDGPYLVVPFFGPASIRDHSGTLVDSMADPLNIYLRNKEEYGLLYGRKGADLLDRRTELLDVLADLKKNSLDYYASVRSTVYQKRQGLIQDGKQSEAITEDFPDFED